jgi:hypothetical protein
LADVVRRGSAAPVGSDPFLFVVVSADLAVLHRAHAIPGTFRREEDLDEPRRGRYVLFPARKGGTFVCPWMIDARLEPRAQPTQCAGARTTIGGSRCVLLA